MYGKAAIDFPQRIVCLTAETAEIAFLVGAGDRVVGVPGTARRPEAVRERARVGGFTTFRTDRILALEPDLVLAFSDLQKDIVAELIAAGVAVLCTNQRSFDDVLRAILTLGGALGCAEAARSLVQDMRDEVKLYREYSAGWPDRPRVYFEEWMDPLVAGIRWVSELIEIAGGRDVFADLREGRSAKERVVAPDDVIAARSADHPGLVVRQAGRSRDDHRTGGVGRHQRGPGGRDPRDRRRGRAGAGPVAHARAAPHSRDNSNISIRVIALPAGYNEKGSKSLGRGRHRVRIGRFHPGDIRIE